MKKFFVYLLPLLGIGMGAGFINGLLGAGGGILVVFGLRLLFGKKISNVHSFYASAIAVMLPLSALSAWQYARRGNLPSVSFGTLILPAILGGILGAWLLQKIAPRYMNRIFSAAVLIAGLFMVA